MGEENVFGWEMAPLGELIVFALGGDWGKAPDYGDFDYVDVLCIRGSDLRKWDQHKGMFAALRRVKTPSRDARKLQLGDILIEISGGGPEQPVGRTVVIDRTVLAYRPDIPKICTNFFRLLRPAAEMNAVFLNTFLQFFYKSGAVFDYQGGSNNLRNLRFNDYLTVSVPIPPANEQHRIVAKLEELFSELDEGVASLKIAQKQLKAYRQAVLKHAFEGKLTADWRAANSSELETGDQLLARIRTEREARYQEQIKEWEAAICAWESGGKDGKKPTKPKVPPAASLAKVPESTELSKLPDGWAYTRLGVFIDSIDAGKSFKCDEREPNKDEVGVAKVSAVTWGEYDETESKTCTDKAKENPDFFIRSGDFLLSRANTIDLVGACVIVKRVARRIMLSDKTLRLNFAVGDKAYFLQFLRSRAGRREIMKRSTGNQESMRNIGQDCIRSIIVPICQSAEMEEVVNRLETIFTSVAAIEATVEQELERLQALRQSILIKAFAGQLVPQYPDDEPASVLLERIRAEKAALSKSKRRRQAAPA